MRTGNVIHGMTASTGNIFLWHLPHTTREEETTKKNLINNTAHTGSTTPLCQERDATIGEGHFNRSFEEIT